MAFNKALLDRFEAAEGDATAQAAVAAELVIASRTGRDRQSLEAALEGGAVLHWFDADLLRTVLQIRKKDAVSLAAELGSMPFVEAHKRGGTRFFNVHESTRLGWRKQLALAQAQRFRELSARAASCFVGDLTAAGRIEWIYHCLCAEPDHGANELATLYRAWSAAGRSSDCYALAATIGELYDQGLVEGRATVWVALVVASASFQGEASRTESTARELLALARATEDARAEAAAHALLGQALSAQGRLTEAAVSLNNDLTIKAGLAERHPDDWGVLWELATAQTQLGDLLEAQGKPSDALRAFEQALTIHRHLVERDPTSLSMRRRLAVAHGRLARALQLQGNAGEARRSLDEGLTISRILAAENPSDLGRRRELAVGHGQMGELLVAQGDKAGAERAFLEARDIGRSLVDQDAANTTWRRDLAVVIRQLGDLLESQGRLGEAHKSFGEALRISQQLCEQDSTNMAWQQDLTVSRARVKAVRRRLAEDSERVLPTTELPNETSSHVPRYRSGQIRDSERLFLENLALIERIIAAQCRRQRLTREECEDFASAVKLRFIADDYQVLRSFSGREGASLRGYLIAVALQAYQDYRSRLWGKWRPSAEARRLGPLAVRLDMMLHRDGLTLDEAYALAAPGDREEMRRLAAKLPARARRRMEDADQLTNLLSDERSPEVALIDREREAVAEGLKRVLAEAVENLPPEDRLLLQLRLERNVRLADLARVFNVEPRLLYRRWELLIRALRKRLELSGYGAPQVARALDSVSGPTDLLSDAANPWSGSS